MNKKATITLAILFALPASMALAQRPGGGPPPGPPPGPHPNQQGGGAGAGNDPASPPREGKPHPSPISALLKALDTDHDGIISADEIKAAPQSLLALDKNKDGKLTPDEYLPAGAPKGQHKHTSSDKNLPEQPFPGHKQSPDAGNAALGGANGAAEKPQRPPAPPLIAALDADGDGVISAAEIANAATALLTLDKNGDGQLGPSEYDPHPEGQPPDGKGPKPPKAPKGAQ